MVRQIDTDRQRDKGRDKHKQTYSKDGGSFTKNERAMHCSHKDTRAGLQKREETCLEVQRHFPAETAPVVREEMQINKPVPEFTVKAQM